MISSIIEQQKQAQYHAMSEKDTAFLLSAVVRCGLAGMEVQFRVLGAPELRLLWELLGMIQG